MEKAKKSYKRITKKNMLEIIKILENEYKDAKCGLDYTTPLSLVIALILAAQCTDARVNIICPILFKKFPDVHSINNADIKEIEEIIRPCGFYKNKAKSIKGACQKLEKDFKIKVDKKKIELKETIKVLGITNVEIKLYEGVVGILKVQVVSEK